MDIISHALWSSALFKSVNLKLNKKRFNIWKAALFGMFPDIFAFVVPGIIFFFIIIFQTQFNFVNLSTIIQSPPYSDIIEMLYNISHSLIIFTLVFLLIWLIFRKPIWIMFGWFLHILIDIPTHLIGHFATPLFWPISNFRINGFIYWREPWFMIVDVILLVVVYGIIFYLERKKKKKS
jgi:hypothetical protein